MLPEPIEVGIESLFAASAYGRSWHMGDAFRRRSESVSFLRVFCCGDDATGLPLVDQASAPTIRYDAAKTSEPRVTSDTLVTLCKWEGSTVRRRELCSFLGSAALAWPLSARAQQPARRRVGHLAIAAPTDTPPPPPANWDAFVQGLRETGFVEGSNIVFEHRSAHNQPDLFPKLALELASDKVDVIFARGTSALAAAKSATRLIPIVGIDLEIDPVEAGLVESIGRPGGNITGLFLDLSVLSGKHLQILKEIVPGASRVAVLGNPDINAPQMRELVQVARQLAVQTRALDVRNATDLDSAFDTAKTWRAHGLIVLSNPLNLAHRARIGDLAAKAGLPAIYLYRAHVGAGGLISYGPDLPDMFRRCGVYVGRILGGTKPADLPIERPARFDLVVNLKTAKALGITIPETILVRADEVIE